MNINDVKIRIVSDIIECERIWKSLSYNEYITDFWAFRKCWHDVYTGEPYFICAVLDGEIIGLLPLEFFKTDVPEVDKGTALPNSYLYFGGGHWNDFSRSFLKKGVSKEVGELLYKQVPPNTWLFVREEESILDSRFKRLADDPVYVLDMSKVPTIEKFFERFSKVSLKSIKRQIKQIEALSPEIKMNDFGDFEKMVELTNKRFGPDSSFVYYGNKYRDVFLNYIRNPELKDYIRFMSVYINGEFKAGAFYFFFNKNLLFAQSGIELENPRNLTKYIIVKKILEAIKLNALTCNFMSCNCGWKEDWHLDKEIGYVLETPPEKN